MPTRAVGDNGKVLTPFQHNLMMQLDILWAQRFAKAALDVQASGCALSKVDGSAWYIAKRCNWVAS